MVRQTQIIIGSDHHASATMRYDRRPRGRLDGPKKGIDARRLNSLGVIKAAAFFE
jgi:hypothetical protein